MMQFPNESKGTPNVICEIRFHGLGGQGVVTTAHLLGLAATKSGLWAHSFPFFSTAQRGGTVRAFTRIADTPIHIKSFIYKPDVLVVFASDLLAVPETLDGWQTGKAILINTFSPESLPDLVGLECQWLDAEEIARSVLGRSTISTVMAGAVLSLSNIVPFEYLEQAIEETFARKIAKMNIRAARIGFETCTLREVT